ncbi:Ammonium transporter [Planococcus halocryophilus Or1]|uniref:Ammonium transporter n=1 Tax=Planococcus halocryophilus TaxID=1215089 RepID=A0A1C7DV02_9BACL|nr:ammonium transporter [Planococcus halocryophilus]ANU15043.1 ammonium transporter [Planococcus halocryophilus]EMF45723.1 Ammonium transporter [Planococcus halocryophilus Or1]
MEAVQSSVDMIWVMLGAMLVFFMHAGFAMVESGFTRSKNTLNILMKNIITVSLGSILYFIVGYALMFGPSSFGLIGTQGFALSGVEDIGFFVFQAVFAATCATIISGAVAERMNLSAYILLTIAMTAIIYPVVGHWVWGGGWLSQIGFIDFAGSTVVHLTGGVAAFVAAWKIGPRLGKYSGKSINTIPGHSLPLGALGVFILWLGWFGFNGGSTLAADPTLVPVVIANTLLAASSGVIATAGYTRLRYGRIDASLTMNGALAGLVGITAGAANVSFVGAIAIGLLAGVIMTEAIRLLDSKIRIDDPVGAISVHGIAGIWGTLAIGLFDTTGGLFYGGGAEILGIQAVGVFAVIAWASISTGAVLLAISSFVPLRVTAEDEEAGLDFSEHGSQAYSMQDVLHGSPAGHNNSFAHRLNQLGEAPTPSPKKSIS